MRPACFKVFRFADCVGASLLAAALWLASGTPAAAAALLLAAGSNHSFDPALPPLTYAVADAQAFAGAMRGVGLMPGDQVVVRIDPDRAELVAAFANAKRQFANDDGLGTQKFIFYFSGHADERGLHLKDALLTKEELHRYLEDIPARTKVVVLDSCYAGALAFKGVRPASDLNGPRLALDEPAGTIFLTAASARNAAVESSAVHGSLFTRTLIDGLYGAADANRDGVVTAMELYEYAFRQTQLASYMLPVGTPQKPELVADLKGQGAVTLSFPAGRMGRLTLPADIAGNVAIQSVVGVSSVELTKGFGASTDVPLPVGRYRLWVKDGTRVGQAEVAVKSDEIVTLALDDLSWRPASMELAMAKGPEAEIFHAPAGGGPRVSIQAGVPAPGNVDNIQRPIGGAEPGGFDGRISLTRSRTAASLPGLTVGAGVRHDAFMDRKMSVHEERYELTLGYLWELLPVNPSGFGLQVETGLGAGLSNLHRVIPPPPAYEYYPDVPSTLNSSDRDTYPMAQLGVRMALMTDRAWLGVYHEQLLRTDRGTHDMTPWQWDLVGLGFTL